MPKKEIRKLAPIEPAIDVRGLKQTVAADAYEQLLKLRGQVKLTINVDELRAD
jgi:hypothetical protein